VRPVVWLDGSPWSWEAFGYAAELARGRGVGLVAVCDPAVPEEDRARAVREGATRGVAVEVRVPKGGRRTEVEVCRAGEEEGAEVVVAPRRTATRKVVLSAGLVWLLANAPGPVVVYRSPRGP
jgi:proline dehydrogenase